MWRSAMDCGIVGGEKEAFADVKMAAPLRSAAQI